MNSPSSKIDLSTGLSIYLVCNISSKQKREGRKVIFEFADYLTPAKITIGLTHKNDLAIWIIDNDKKTHLIGNLRNSSFLNIKTLILVKIKELEKGQFEISITSYYDDQSIIENVNLNLSGKILMEYSVGATIDGKENAAFSLQELILRSKIDDDKGLGEIVQYLFKKHNLNHV